VGGFVPGNFKLTLGVWIPGLRQDGASRNDERKFPRALSRFNFQTALHRHCERSEAIHGAARKTGLLRRFAPRNDVAPISDTPPPSRGAMRPSCCVNVPSKNRGRRECRVPAAPVAARVLVVSTRVSHHRYSRNHPAFPAQWF
jgi:hypothetical protein